MPALPVPRQEAFAQALAMDLSLGEAAAKAGYANNWKHARQRAAKPHIVARVTALREALTPAEAAKPKGRPEAGLIEVGLETPEDLSRYLPLSDEDWLAKYGNNGQPMATAAT